MTSFKQHIQTFIKGWKKSAQKDREEKQINELIAHVEDSSTREIYKTVLTNQLNYIKTEAAATAKKCPKCGTYVKPDNSVSLILPRITVRILDNLMVLQGMVGIQPMQGPVGLVYFLRYRTQEDKKITLEIISSAVEACSRKLSAAWTFEAVQDMQSQHEVDIESEIVQALSSEIATEIIEEHLHNLRSFSRVDGELPLKTFKLEGDVPFGRRGDWLSVIINKEANDIARDTRRGAGNFVVVSPTILAELQTSRAFVKSTLEKGEVVGPAQVLFVGTLNETTRVYCDIFTPENEVLVGYKGGNGETDTGYVFCPYVLLMNSGIVVNPVTFQPVMGMMTRYGTQVQENAAKYYSTFTVDMNYSDD